MIRITVDDREVANLFQRLESALKDLRPAMNSIGTYILSETDNRFKTQRSPSGEPWIPSKRALGQGSKAENRKGGEKRGDTLRDSGILRDSLTQRSHANNIFQTTETSVTVGTSVPYAAAMHFGARKGQFGDGVAKIRSHTRRMGDKEVRVKSHLRYVPAIPWGNVPARPFLGVNNNDIEAIFEIMNRHLQKAFGK